MAQTNRQIPRATIHKQFLDAAAAAPEASIEELAGEVSGTSVGLVERVLDQYGEPTETEADEAGGDEDNVHDRHQMLPNEALTEPDELTDEQRVVLQAIGRQPEATQSEIAEKIGVSASTVNRRLHKIDRFDWGRRNEIVGKLLPTAPTVETEPVAPDGVSDGSGTTVEPGANGDWESGPDERDGGGTDQADEVAPTIGGDPDDSGAGLAAAELRERLDGLEERVNQTPTGSESAPQFDDSRLAAKIIWACMASESISDEEELQVIETLLAPSGRG